MSDLANGIAAVGVGWLLTYLVHSTVLVGAAWLALRTGWVRDPQSQDLLWKVAALAGLATATAAIGPPPSSRPAETYVEVESVAWASGPGGDEVLHWRRDYPEGAEAGISARIRLSTPGTMVLLMQAGSPSPGCSTLLKSGGLGAPGVVERIREACAVPARVEWYHVLMMIWVGGAIIAACASWARRRDLRDLRATLTDAGPTPSATLAELAAGSRARPRLVVSAALDAPCVIDGRTIAIPERCEAELEDDELRAVLAHEVAHVARRDVAWLALLRGVAGVLWLQPLNRVALRGQLAAAELVCDDWALARTRQRLGLARSISRVAEWAVAPRRRREATVVAMVGGDGRSLAGRVRRILSSRDTVRTVPRWRRAAAAIALVVPVLLLPPVPGPATLHAAIFIERRVELGPDFVIPPRGVPEGAERRVLIRRVQRS